VVRTSLVLLALFVSSNAYALEIAGDVRADGRVFLAAPRHLGQRLGTAPSVAISPIASVQTDDLTHTLTVQPFLRVDAADAARTHWDLRQADYQFATGGFSFGAGIGTFTSGVLDTHRVVDVVNQRDLVEDLDGSVKLGQPYVGIGYATGPWAFTFQYLPYHRKRTFPGERGRLRFPLLVDDDEVLYESKLGPWHPSFAARASVATGPFDIGVSGFSGLSREPRFFGQIFDASAVVPQYDFLQQAAVDAQWTLDALIIKGEAAARWWSKDLRFFVAAGGGAEYHFYDLWGTGADLAFLAEYHFDGRAPDAPVAFFDNDVVTGLRLAINDTGDTQFIAGVVRDLANTATYARAQIFRRFGDRWRAALEARMFLGQEGQLESGLLDDDYLQGSVVYFF
jgi:hypothetical protein